MEIGIKEYIIAIVTMNKEIVIGGTAPTFHVKNQDQLERLSLLIAKTTRGMVHDLEGGTYIIVKH